jgi:hypothetical protein
VLVVIKLLTRLQRSVSLSNQQFSLQLGHTDHSSLQLWQTQGSMTNLRGNTTTTALPLQHLCMQSLCDNSSCRLEWPKGAGEGQASRQSQCFAQVYTRCLKGAAARDEPAQMNMS